MSPVLAGIFIGALVGILGINFATLLLLLKIGYHLETVRRLLGVETVRATKLGVRDNAPTS